MRAFVVNWTGLIGRLPHAARAVLPTLALVLLALSAAPAAAQHPGASELDELNRRISTLYRSGRYAEAIPVAERTIALARTRLGDKHPSTAFAIGWLGYIIRAQGRYREAEQYTAESLAILEQALGPDHFEVGGALDNLAELYRDMGRYREAIPLSERGLAVREKALGPDRAEVGYSLNNLGLLYEVVGREKEAEPLFVRAISLYERVLGPEHRELGMTLDNLGKLYHTLERYTEAEQALKRGLAIREKTMGREHEHVGWSLNNIARLYRFVGREREAEPLYRRAIAIYEKALGPAHREVGNSLTNLADLYVSMGRLAEAEPLYKRALTVTEAALGPAHEATGYTLSNLGWLYMRGRRDAEAEPLLRRSLAIVEGALGPDHIQVASLLAALATVHRNRGDYAEAETLLKRGLATNLRVLGPDSEAVGWSWSSLADLAYRQGDYDTAAGYWRRSTAGIVRRAGRSVQALAGRGRTEVQKSGVQFWTLAKSLQRLAERRPSDAKALAREMFLAAQWAESSEAAASLAQMAARGSRANARLEPLVRERQDLVGEWQRIDATQSAAASLPPGRRDHAVEQSNAARLVQIDRRIAEIDRNLAAEYPNYAALARPEPLSVEQVQAELRPDEALIAFLDTPAWPSGGEETFVWAITRGDMRLVRSELGSSALNREVTALRCGLDRAAWDETGAAICARLLGLPRGHVPAADAPLPFDHARAQKLYDALLAPLAGIIDGKQLLLVPSGSLTRLPFQVLVTEKPAGNDDRTVAWLARRHALTVLPAVSSLGALRRVARPSAATEPMLGVGNPLLDGPDPRYARLASLARDLGACDDTRIGQLASVVGLTTYAGVAPVVTRSGLADAADLRRQAPLPETAAELCGVAADLGADPAAILLGARATERQIKQMSARGELQRYRVLHFATHGTLAGQITGAAEPGLILTPPGTPSGEDDGYLSAGEIAALKLDADWVILSACNTAGDAGGDSGTEALSGLARAFFYAQARALLVSHWDVNSAATVRLVTGATGSLARDLRIGRAEALQRAMLALIDGGRPGEAHPSFWAPFIVVGEGGR